MATKDTTTTDPETPAVEETQPPAEQGPREDNGRFTNIDNFDNPHEKALDALQTAEDSNGIERIVGPVDTTWTPAPLEASDEEKAAAERRNRMFDKASKRRLEQLTGEIKAEDTGVNDPSQGGSQTSTETVAEAAQKENN